MENTDLLVRNVVSCFIEYEGKVLLFQRSDKVRTFKGHWSALSGSIEKDESPIECCWREIAEETNLTPNDLAFVRGGRPLIVRAAQYNCKYLVHPFLFRVESKNIVDKIELNDENVKFVFGDISSVNPKVPNLLDAYLRVVFVNKEWEDSFIIIEEKRTCATEVTKAAIELFDEFCQNYNTMSPIELETEVRNLGYLLIHPRKSISSVGNVVSRIITKTFRNKEYHSTKDLKMVLKEHCENELAVIENSWVKISRYMDTSLADGSSVLVHSHSSTVCKVLSSLKKQLKVYVTESKPLSEGRKSVLEFLKAPRESIEKVTLVMDSSISKVLSSVDACIVGADTIFKNGSFISKIGAHTLAICAKELGVPFYVLSDSMKISKDFMFDFEECSKDNIYFDETFCPSMEPLLEEMDTLNSFYEVTPSMDVITFITDLGNLKRNDIATNVLRIEEHRNFSLTP